MAGIKDIQAKFAQRLEYLRLKEDFTQQVLAEKLGMTCQDYGEIEGGTVLPTFEALASLSMIFRVSLDWLVFGKEPVLACGLKIIDPEFSEFFEEIEKNEVLKYNVLSHFYEQRVALKKFRRWDGPEGA